MQQKTLVFRGVDAPSFRKRELLPSPGGRLLTVEYSTVSPGTELFSIREGGNEVAPGYIAVGRGEDGRRYFLFPSMSESSGCHSDHLAPGPDSMLFELPETLPAEEAGFLRFVNIGLHPLLTPATLPGRVAVIGLGPVGNLAAQTARLLGCDTVGVDADAARRGLAGECGLATAWTTEELDGAPNRFDLVIDTVCSGATLLSAGRALTEGGACVMVGIVKPGAWDGGELCRLIWNRNVRFVSGWEMKYPMAATAENIRRGIRWMAAGAYRIRPLLTGVIAPELPIIAAAYRSLAERPSDHFCYVIDWRAA